MPNLWKENMSPNDVRDVLRTFTQDQIDAVNLTHQLMNHETGTPLCCLNCNISVLRHRLENGDLPAAKEITGSLHDYMKAAHDKRQAVMDIVNS